jgi:DNA polymerase-1
MGFTVIMVDGVEADDSIATLAAMAERERRVATIVSKDKDLLQLLGPFVFQLQPGTGGQSDKLVTPETFASEHGGLPPAAQIDLLALQGDTSDGIPGVDGVGPVRAQKLLQEYGGLPRVLAAARAGGSKGVLPKKVWAALAETEALVLLGQELATARRAVDLPSTVRSLDCLARRPPDQAALESLADRLDLWDALRQLDSGDVLPRQVGGARGSLSGSEGPAAGRRTSKVAGVTFNDVGPSFAGHHDPKLMRTASDVSCR